MNTLTFNNITLNSISQSDNQIWLTSADLAKALGYVDAKSINRILSRNKDEFTDNMTQVVEGVNLTSTPKTKGLITTTRIFSLRGCHLLAMFSRTKVAKDFRKWVLDVLDNEVGAPTIQCEELPSSVKDRNGLVKAAKITQYKLGIGYDDVFSLIHHRFNIDKLGDLTASQVGEATEYIQRMRYPQLAETRHQSDHKQAAEQITEDIEYGSTPVMVNQVMSSGKFIGAFDSSGRMTMREMKADEFVTTLEDLPRVVERSKINPYTLAKINFHASHRLAAATYYRRDDSPLNAIQGATHDH